MDDPLAKFILLFPLSYNDGRHLERTGGVIHFIPPQPPKGG